MDREKRKGNVPVPENFEELLNKAQLQALPGMKHAGWEIQFLRTPLFQEPVLVVKNSKDGRIGVLDKDGVIKIQPDFKVRESITLTEGTQPVDPLTWTK
mgnify:CR=1 FL=1